MKLSTRLLVFPVLLLTVASCSSVPPKPPPAFTMRDHVGRNWHHELVQYKLSADAIRAIGKQRLVDGAGREAVYQVDTDRHQLIFHADVQPYGASRYTFADGSADTTTDLTVATTDAYIELSNDLTGIRVAKALPATTTAAPILAWRLASGPWVGTTRFAQPQKIAEYTMRVIERGPVRATAVSTTTFENGDTWEITIELQAGEPTVKITETFECSEVRNVVFDFSKDFSAAHAFARSSSRQAIDGQTYDYGSYLSQPLEGRTGTILTLEPWVHWGGDPRRTTRFSLADAEWRDVVFFATCNAAAWVDPEIDPGQRAHVTRPVERTAEGILTLGYELATGKREYLIGAVPGAADRQNLEDGRRVPTQAQIYQMKYSDFPLDRVKDYTLTWAHAEADSPGFISEEHLRDLLADFEVDQNTLERLRQQDPTIHSLETSLPYYLATKDEQLARRLIDAALKQVQDCVDKLVHLENDVITVGYAPHHYRAFVTTCNLVATIVDSPQMTDAERSKLHAQLAFLGYLFNRDAFSSPARGFNGFPNMTACVYGVRAGIASVVPGHPRQKQWMRGAVGDLKADFLDQWSDADGNWIGTHTESFSYTRLIFDLVLGGLYHSYRSGVDTDSLFSPTVKQMGEWFAHVATPRDARVLNWRHDPPVGHVYKFDMLPSQFAMLAFMWKDRDPEFAAQMKWMQLEQGNRQIQSVGGFIPSFAGFRKLFMANKVAPKEPTYESRHWNESSVILRNHYGHDLENMLYIIAGKGHSHYDRDSGSVTLWGKGEIIADDFGYYGYAPGEDHNMLDTPVAAPATLMRIADFSKGPHVDYVRGEKDAWTRRIFFVKHDDPQGPNYYVIQDTLSLPAPATWRMWFTADNVTVDGRQALVEGLHRVDSDIYFARLPNEATVTREDKTRRPYGVNSEGLYRGRNPTTQTGIIIDAPRYESMLALVYPRLKDEAQASVTPIADGRGFKVVSPAGTDYVFLADEKIVFTEDRLSFEGTAGFARLQGDAVSLDLKEGGEISYGEKTLKKESVEPPTQSTNLIHDGELDSGDFSIFPQQPARSAFRVDVLSESPLSTASPLTGAYCQKVVCETKGNEKWQQLLRLRTSRIFVDSRKTYRVHARVYIPGETRVFLSSYAHDADGNQLKGINENAWGWSLRMQGPTDGFVDFETTIGPADSGAAHRFPPGTLSLDGLGVRLYDEGDTFYIDDLVIQSIDDNE